MKNLFRKITSTLVVLTLMCFVVSAQNMVDTQNNVNLALNSESACLMESSTGKILFEQNADEKLEPASVTKIMSLLLIMEALDDGVISLETQVMGSEHASSMGGSQIWLEVGEQLSVNDMLKAIVVASANDCTVAMAEHLAGSEEAFVDKMNQKASTLKMENTHFSNCTGLPTENHYTTARDIAIMTRELLKHDTIFNYTSIWMDSLRGGQMDITNTNKLIRFYNGANGMKTGFTSSALYCLSATAKRGDMQLIAVTMKGQTSDKRFQDAKKLLDYGFANYSIYKAKTEIPTELSVKGGKNKTVKIGCEYTDILVSKGLQNGIEEKIELESNLKAPIEKGTQVGKIVYIYNDSEIQSIPVYTLEDCDRLSLKDIIFKVISSIVSVR